MSIIGLSITLPSGLELAMRRGSTHITSDMNDIDFARKQTGVQIMDPSQSEIIAFMDKIPQVPTVDKEITVEQALEFLWHDVDEEHVLEHLLERGYVCEKVGAEPEAIKDAKLKLKFNKVSDKDFKAEYERRYGDTSKKKK